MNGKPVYEALEELRAYHEDLQRASHSTFEGVLARYVALFKAGSVLGLIADRELPHVDYESWWRDVRATVGGMIGSGTLTWPLERPARVALQRELLLHMAAGEPDVMTFNYHFFHASNRFDDQIREFTSQVIEPFHRDFATLLNPALQEERAAATSAIAPSVLQIPPGFIARNRIGRFRELDRVCGFDLRKLIQLCEELNLAFAKSSWFSVAFLTRAVLDHIPPAFGQRTFAQVVAGESGRSIKAAASSLDEFARKVADEHLHSGLREHDSLPNEIQIFAAPALDLVLGEVEVRLTKRAQVAAIPSRGK